MLKMGGSASGNQSPPILHIHPSPLLQFLTPSKFLCFFRMKMNSKTEDEGNGNDAISIHAEEDLSNEEETGQNIPIDTSLMIWIIVYSRYKTHKSD